MAWIHKDLRTKIAIARRIERTENGNLEDSNSVGGGVSEIRIDIGAGFWLYYTMREKAIVILLVGGTKDSQQSAIKKAIKLAKEF